MRLLIWLAFNLITSLTLLAVPRDIGVEKPSQEIVAGLKKTFSEQDGIFIWDGNAQLILLVRVMDEVSRKPIFGATVSVVRDRRVRRGPSGRTYETPGSGRTDSVGHAIIRASFPAAGDASGLSVFVCDSYVTIKAPGHAPARARISPTYRLDFPRRIKDCKVPLHLTLKRKERGRRTASVNPMDMTKLLKHFLPLTVEQNHHDPIRR